MLRDERLQKVVTDIDAAPDRERVSGGGCFVLLGSASRCRLGGPCCGERSLSIMLQALVRALQAPNFMEFADQVGLGAGGHHSRCAAFSAIVSGRL